MADSANTHDDSVVTPFTTTFDKAAPPQKARSRNKEKVSKAGPSAKAPDYEALGVPPERIPEMEDARLASLAIGRLTTSQVYEYAEIIARVRGWTDDQKQFDKWSTAIFKLGRRGAHNFVMVHEKLQDDRDRLIALGLPKASLNELAVAEPEKREEIIQVMEAGTELTAAKIKAMASATGDADSETSAADAGGVAGLKARIAEKVSTGMPALMTTGVEILRIILVALEPHRRGKRVEKGVALRQLVLPARLLREQLKWLTWVAMPRGENFSTTEVHVQPLSRDDRWYELYQILEQLGGYESWPDAGDVGTWLTETVVPQLEWMLGNHAAKARTVLVEMEKAAEADKARAAKDKAKVAAQTSRKQVGKAKPRASAPAAAEPVETPEAAPAVTVGSKAPTPKKPRTRKTAAQDAVATDETVKGTGRTAREAEPVALPAQPVAVNAPQSDPVMAPDAATSDGAGFAPPPFLARRQTKKDANVSAT